MNNIARISLPGTFFSKATTSMNAPYLSTVEKAGDSYQGASPLAFPLSETLNNEGQKWLLFTHSFLVVGFAIYSSVRLVLPSPPASRQTCRKGLVRNGPDEETPRHYS